METDASETMAAGDGAVPDFEETTNYIAGLSNDAARAVNGAAEAPLGATRLFTRLFASKFDGAATGTPYADGEGQAIVSWQLHPEAMKQLRDFAAASDYLVALCTWHEAKAQRQAALQHVSEDVAALGLASQTVGDVDRYLRTHANAQTEKCSRDIAAAASAETEVRAAEKRVERTVKKEEANRMIRGFVTARLFGGLNEKSPRVLNGPGWSSNFKDVTPLFLGLMRWAMQKERAPELIKPAPTIAAAGAALQRWLNTERYNMWMQCARAIIVELKAADRGNIVHVPDALRGLLIPQSNDRDVNALFNLTVVQPSVNALLCLAIFIHILVPQSGSLSRRTFWVSSCTAWSDFAGGTQGYYALILTILCKYCSAGSQRIVFLLDDGQDAATEQDLITQAFSRVRDEVGPWDQLFDSLDTAVMDILGLPGSTDLSVRARALEAADSPAAKRVEDGAAVAFILRRTARASKGE